MSCIWTSICAAYHAQQHDRTACPVIHQARSCLQSHPHVASFLVLASLGALCPKQAETVIDEEAALILSTVVRNHFRELEVIARDTSDLRSACGFSAASFENRLFGAVFRCWAH